MKSHVFFTLLLIFEIGCSEKKPAEIVQDTSTVALTPAEVQPEESMPAEINSNEHDTSAQLTEEEALAEELEYEAQNMVNTAPQNVDEKDNVVRFMEEGFDIGAPFFGREAVSELPSFLKQNNIKYNLKKTEASKDPDDYESTDTYIYTFDGSRIEIAYDQVTSATIYSPAFEWDNIKVGMGKKDFTARFPYLSDFYSYNQFQLHIGSFNSGCYVQFDFEEDKIVMIKYIIFVQDCG